MIRLYIPHCHLHLEPTQISLFAKMLNEGVMQFVWLAPQRSLELKVSHTIYYETVITCILCREESRKT